MMRNVLVVFALLATACGARSYISAGDSTFPVSMSSAVQGPDGTVLVGSDLQTVGAFRLDYKKCNMLWTLIPLFFRTEDISDEIDEQVRRAHGEAVINLTVQSSATVWNVLTLFGVLPDCSNVRIRGEIVIRRGLASRAL
jgi:hypothetical protein